jgi:cytochrome c peroxidase
MPRLMFLALAANRRRCADVKRGRRFRASPAPPSSPPCASVLPPEDKGRLAVTKTVSDEYVFRAAPLRNVELTEPYFHSGTVWSLEQAVAIMGDAQLGIELTDKETKAVTAFLRSLTGVQPRIEYPILPPSTSKTPRPVADIAGRGGH